MKKRKIFLALSVITIFIFLSLYLIGTEYVECDNLVWGSWTCGGSNFCFYDTIEEDDPICNFICKIGPNEEDLECFPAPK